jgi:ER lumen protein retaining receptor
MESNTQMLMNLFASPLQTLILFYFIIEDHDTLFVMSEGVHFMGIGVLAYKLLKKRNCGGM